MQPLVTPVRSELTEAQVYALVKTDPAVRIGRGMELVNRNLDLLADITGDLRECTVSRNNYDTLHGHANFNIVGKLQWGQAIVRPYMTISNGVTTARFNLGAYFTSTPDNVEDQLPAIFAVEGYDMLNALNTLVGDSYAINIGDSYLTKVEDILQAQGYTQYTIDPSRIGTTATVAKAWPIDETTTWLTIVNDLLTAIGYRGIYSDWNGRLVCESYLSPTVRGIEWTYDRGLYTSQLVPGTTVVHDYFAAPNRWVGIRSSTQDTTGTATLTEGNGIYTFVNMTDGETSVEARQQTITKVITVDVADQSALIAAVQSEVAKDKAVNTTLTATTSANPLHWHFDILSVETTSMGTLKVQESDWSLDLVDGKMTHSWAVI